MARGLVHRIPPESVLGKLHTDRHVTVNHVADLFRATENRNAAAVFGTVECYYWFVNRLDRKQQFRAVYFALCALVKSGKVSMIQYDEVKTFRRES